MRFSGSLIETVTVQLYYRNIYFNIMMLLIPAPCRAQKLYRSPGIANYAMVRTLSSTQCAVSKAGTPHICIAQAAIHEAVGAAWGTGAPSHLDSALPS